MDLAKYENLSNLFKEVLSMYANYFQFKDYTLKFEDYHKIKNTIKLKKEAPIELPLVFGIDDLIESLKIKTDFNDTEDIFEKMINNVSLEFKIIDELEYVKSIKRLYQMSLHEELDESFINYLCKTLQAQTYLRDITTNRINAICLSDNDFLIYQPKTENKTPLFRLKEIDGALKVIDICHNSKNGDSLNKIKTYNDIIDMIVFQKIKYVEVTEKYKKITKKTI